MSEWKKIRLPCFKGSMEVELHLESGTINYVKADVPPETVAHGLAAVSRFGGQTKQPYSVGEHSVRLGWLMRDHGYGPAFEKAAHLHDGPECFGVGDMNSFVKKALKLERVKTLDTAIVVALWRGFGCEKEYGLEWEDVEPAVHKFDKWLGHHEAQTFGFYVPPEAKFDPLLYGRRGNGMARLVGYWSPEKAKEAWLWNWSRGADGRK